MADAPAQAEPALRALVAKAPDRDAVEVPVPEAQALTEERVKEVDLRTISHVVIQEDSSARSKKYSIFANNLPQNIRCEAGAGLPIRRLPVRLEQTNAVLVFPRKDCSASHLRRSS